MPAVNSKLPSPVRRRLLALGGLAWAGQARATDAVLRGQALQFPRDHGAHLEARTEWWYVTGWLGTPAAPLFGFQVTFFRSRTGLAADNPSRFAARQLLFAHAALTDLRDLGNSRHRHDQRIARWDGSPAGLQGQAAVNGGDIRLGQWALHDDGAGWRAQIDGGSGGDAFALKLELQRTQPLLLQGDVGFSRKGPSEAEASHYYTEPQLLARADIRIAGRNTTAQGKAWLDHEWSDHILAADAVGWDWIGMNLFDGSALTAFVLRRRDGSALWAGGSWRPAPSNQTPAMGSTGGRPFGPKEVAMTPLKRWRSPSSGADYPVQWRLQTPLGSFVVRALVDAQELDSRRSTGSIYWEGISELVDPAGQRVGLGYLEMTGYASPLKTA